MSGKCSAQMYQKKHDDANFLPTMSSVGLDIYRCFLTITELVPLRGSPPRFLLNRKRKSCLQAPRNDMKIQKVIFNSGFSYNYFTPLAPEFATLGCLKSHIFPE